MSRRRRYGRPPNYLGLLLGLLMGAGVGAAIGAAVDDLTPLTLGAAAGAAGMLLGTFVSNVLVIPRGRWTLWGTARTAGAIVAVLFLLLVGFHFLNTAGGFSGSFVLAWNDLKLAARCPDKPETVLAFIARTPAESFDLGFASLFGEDVSGYVCEYGWPPPR